MPCMPSGFRRRAAGPFLQAPENPAGGVFSRRASVEGRGQASRGQQCAAGLGSRELTNFTRRDAACALGIPHPHRPSHALPSLSARSDRAACVFPGGGRQTAGHCVIHIPRSPMCVAVCVTDGAPGACEGRGVNFLLKGPNTCVRSFLYYFGERRGGTRKPFCPRPRFREGVHPHPSAVQTPRLWESPAALPQAPGRKARSAFPFKPRSIHPPRSFVSGKGTEQGGGIEQLMFEEEAQDASRPAGAGPQSFSNPRAIDCFGHLQPLVWGWGCALVPVPLPALPLRARGRA